MRRCGKREPGKNRVDTCGLPAYTAGPAQMAELVDAHGSGPCAARRGGSTPLLGTKRSVLPSGSPSGLKPQFPRSEPKPTELVTKRVGEACGHPALPDVLKVGIGPVAGVDVVAPLEQACSRLEMKQRGVLNGTR